MRLVEYIRSSITELQKVTWPSRSIIIRHTILVTVSMGLATLFVALVDSGLNVLVRIMLERS